MDSITSAITSLTLDFDIDTIRSGLESLPQELYDKIYVDVFTANSGERIVTPSSERPILHLANYREVRNDPTALMEMKRTEALRYKALRYDPKLLHVSRSTRALYAKTYYGPGSKFIFDVCFTLMPDRHQNYRADGENCYIHWLQMLPAAHVDLLEEVVITGSMLCGRSALQDVVGIRSILRTRGFEEAVALKVLLLYEGRVYGRELGFDEQGRQIVRKEFLKG